MTVPTARAVQPLRAMRDGPRVLRGVAAGWPAIARWTFPYLASLAPDMPVRLVLGNRERSATHFVDATLGQYLGMLEAQPGDAQSSLYLKEFDLLGHFPALKDDLRTAPLFPSGAWVWNDVWIGPRGSRTGLHRDRLDNIAVLLRGRKRFRLAPPGSVEALGARSTKYDRVSVMATADLDELATRTPRPALYEVELAPGDALYTPAGWWHEVENLEPSVFLSGFFGGRLEVSAKWLATLPLHLLHRAGLWRRGNCVCHERRP
jgi:lysine-specific demethylase 8|nr:cupin-like domain-containing protein [uncultured Caldimonas sp.]